MNLKLLLLLSTSILVTGSPLYTLADLGTLGSSSITAAGMNAMGQTVGYMSTPSGYLHAFSSLDGGLIDLTAQSAGTQGTAAGINDSGAIAGTQYIGGQAYASVWTDGTASTVAGIGSYALAINSAGEVAGMLTRNGQGNAFVALNGTVIDLGTFSGGSWSSAYSINDAGQAAGYGMTSTGAFRAFIWTPGRGYSVLGTLGGGNSYAMSINNAGVVTGNAQVSGGYSHAFVSNGTSMQDLGTLGGPASYGYGINNVGVEVGYSWTSGYAMHGFLEEGGVMWDINSLLIDAPGWVVTALYAVNDSNQVVGVGVLNGVEHAVLLTDPPAPDDFSMSVSSFSLTSTNDAIAAPEPATWICTISALALLLVRRKSIRRASPPQPRQQGPLPTQPQ